jgi:hypothetical protein
MIVSMGAHREVTDSSRIQTGSMDQLPKYVVDAIWKGRAVLIAGQDLARGETQGLLGSDASLHGLRVALAQPSSPLLDRVASLRASAPDSAHVEVAQAPWALVFSSAVDTRLASALEAAAPAARRGAFVVGSSMT